MLSCYEEEIVTFGFFNIRLQSDVNKVEINEQERSL